MTTSAPISASASDAPIEDEGSDRSGAERRLPRARRLLSMYWPLLALTLAVAAAALVSRYMLFPAFSWNRDEPVYLWHVEVLRSGRFTSTDGGEPLFFRPWLTGAEDGVLFSQYTLGWPLVLLAASVVFGSPTVALPACAVFAVLATYAFTRELTADHTLAVVSAVVMAANPIVLVQGGMYLGYLFTLGLGLSFATLLLSGVRRDRRLRIVGAGVLLGWIFLTRPFDALIWGVAVVGYLVVVRRSEWRRLIGVGVWFAVGVLPLAAATLAYNRYVTGGFGEFPVTAADPLDKYGFGPRRIMPAFGVTDYDLVEAVRGTGKNALAFPRFLAGSYVGVLVALVGLWLRRRSRGTGALLAIAVLFPLGYFPFWGTSLSGNFARFTGPFYFLPLYVPTSVLIATVIIAAWRRRRAWGIGVLALLTVATVPMALDRFHLNRELSRAQLPWKESTAAIDGPALVFVADGGPYLMFVNPFGSNDPELDGEVLFAADRGAANIDLIRKMPERTPYIQEASVPIGELFPRTYPVTPEIRVTPLEIVDGDVISFDVRVTNNKGAPTVVAAIVIGDRIEYRSLATDSTKGAVHETRWQVAAADADGQSPDGSVLGLPGRLGRVEVVVGFGTDFDAAQRSPAARYGFPYRIDDGSVEVLTPAELERVHRMGGKGEWRRAVSLTELDVQASAATPR